MASFGDVDRNVTITFIGRDRASAAMRGIGSSATRTSGIVTKLTAVLKAAAIAAATALAAAAAVAGYALFNLGKQSIEAASTLNESINAVKVTWGKAADDILNQSRKAAEGLGLARSEFNAISVQFASFAKTIAGKGGDAAGTLDELVTRGSDFASVMNLEVNESLRLFQSGLAGETEPLRRFGIDLSAAAVTAFALKKGIAASADSITESEKVQARYQLLMKQTAKVQGDFKNTSGELANSQRRLNANWENAKAKIGKGLLPIMQQLVNWANSTLVPWIKKTMVPAFRDFTKWIQNEAVPWIKDELIPWLKETWKVLKEDWIPTFVTVAQKAGKVVGKIIELVDAIGDFFAADDEGGGMATTIDLVAQSFSNALIPLKAYLDYLGFMIDKWTWVIEKATAFKDAITGGGDGGGTSRITGPGTGVNADGGWLKRAMGGWTMVGEHGPELINNRGFVKPHSASMGGAGGGNVYVTVQGAVDPVGTARQIRQILAKGDRASGRGALGLA